MTKSPQFARLCRVLREKNQASTDFNSVALLITQELCQWFHCEWGTFWRIDSADELLDPIVSWREPSLPADRLLKETRNKRLQMGEGNAGIVWRTGQPKCNSDLVLEMCLPRSLEAIEAGLRAGIWIPVQGRSAMLGVIELLGTHYWIDSESFRHELEQIGNAVGEALEIDHYNSKL